LGGARQQHVTDDFGAGRTARFAGLQHAETERFEPCRQRSGVRRLAGALPALEGDETSAQDGLVRFLSRSASLGARSRRPRCHHSRLNHPRTMLMTNSLTASKARPVRLPGPTFSAACNGTSRLSVSLRHTLRWPIGWPCSTGARTGPTYTSLAVMRSPPER